MERQAILANTVNLHYDDPEDLILDLITVLEQRVAHGGQRLQTNPDPIVRDLVETDRKWLNALVYMHHHST